MFCPQSNPFRQYIHLSEFYDFRFDPEQRGEQEGWADGFAGGRPIAVPSSWNDLFEDCRDYLGLAWYQTRFDLPWGWQDREVMLRFGSVNYLARVWLNGQFLGFHEGGNLPFEFEITPFLRTQGNLLVVLVDGALAPDRVPPGQVAMNPLDTFTTFESYPSGSFVFFPYCGIQRPVILYTNTHQGIQAINLTTSLREKMGIVQVNIAQEGTAPLRLQLKGNGTEITFETLGSEGMIEVPDPALWGPGSPSLYELSSNFSIPVFPSTGTYYRSEFARLKWMALRSCSTMNRFYYGALDVMKIFRSVGEATNRLCRSKILI